LAEVGRAHATTDSPGWTCPDCSITSWLAVSSGGRSSPTIGTAKPSWIDSACLVRRPRHAPVVLLWRGGLGNETVVPATLRAVVPLRDGNGRPLLELDSAAVAAERFGRVRCDGMFRVPREVWRQSAPLDSRGRPEEARVIRWPRARARKRETPCAGPRCASSRSWRASSTRASPNPSPRRCPGGTGEKCDHEG